MIQHFVNISGGKDSTATYLLALERGRPFRAIMADTGHEHPATLEYASRLGERTGGPGVEIFRADFSEQIHARRESIAKKWEAEGVPADKIERARQALRPTGIPFLDLCLWKGLFPSTQRRFCTEYLKERPIAEQVIEPALARGPVCQWLGIRRDESPRRADAPMFQRVRRDGTHDMLLYRPLIHWTARDVFDLHKRHGLPPNPLYLQGMGRIGCFPCIMARKQELGEIARRFPWAFERLREWEGLVSDASRRGLSTFFAADTTPEGARMVARGIKGPYPDALAVAEWSQTDRGGRQFNLLTTLEADEGLECSSQYALCE